MQVTIRGRRWNLVYDKQRDTDGLCDPPSTKSKRIRIAYRLRRNESRLLAVLIHECLHAADWDKDEEWVSDVSEDIARILQKQGFRLQPGYPLPEKDK